MANKFSNRPDFTLPSALFDEHEWVMDAFIDGQTGQPCKLIYKQIETECPNCYQDTSTGRSSGIYKPGGPISFTNYTTCPYCNGEGRSTLPNTETINLRTYWDIASWRKLGFAHTGNTIVQVIGYMKDLSRLERAVELIVVNDKSNVREWRCVRDGEAAPWGFRQDRYFVQNLKRAGGN